MDPSRQSNGSIEWEERYQNLLGSLNIGFLLGDTKFHCLDVNKFLRKWSAFHAKNLWADTAVNSSLQMNLKG